MKRVDPLKSLFGGEQLAPESREYFKSTTPIKDLKQMFDATQGNEGKEYIKDARKYVRKNVGVMGREERNTGLTSRVDKERRKEIEARMNNEKIGRSRKSAIKKLLEGERNGE